MVAALTQIGHDLKPLNLTDTQIGYDQYQSGVYLFAKSAANTTSVIYIARNQEPSIKGIIETLTAEGSYSIKLVGLASLRSTVKEALADTSSKVVGEAEAAENSKVFFYGETFKVRIEKPAANFVAPQEKDPNRVRKVFIVDDSGTMRKVLRQTLESHPKMQIVGETGRPSLAEEMIKELQPDVITLDIHMPEMDGITLLKKLHQKFDIPIVMISSISKEEGVTILKALELGAVDYIEKPRFDQMEASAPEIVEKVFGASDIVLKKVARAIPKLVTAQLNQNLPILIGSSTGGTEALKDLLTALPKEIPPILIVQHIPALFSEALARRLNDLCPFEVREAKDGDAVQPETVLIAPGGLHMTVSGSIRSSTVRISDKPDGYRHKPAVDVLFDSASKAYKGDCSAVILTGMGHDGAQGMKKLRDLGALTLGQDKATCVVYGMPRAAFEVGAVQKELPLNSIADYLARYHGKQKKAA